MSSTTGDQGDAVRAALAEMLGTTDIDIVAEVPARLPSGEEVRLAHAAVRGQPNRTASLVVDASGAVYPPRRFEALAGRDLFAPQMHVPERPVETPAAPVTIDPPANEWTLPEWVAEHETVTVHVPVSGVPPKADVYLLADTTGSMSSIIGAVQAGIGAVVSDPAFAGFDVAWGAGNYKDFPIPASSPYAFQQIATDPAIGWRPDSKRILVWFGDAPGHDSVCAAISGVADITETTATDALVAAGITVVAISTDTGVAGALDGDPTFDSRNYGGCTVGGSTGQATRITAATPGGSHTSGVNAATMIATLVSLISSAVHTIGHLELRPTGTTTPGVTNARRWSTAATPPRSRSTTPPAAR